LREGLFGGLQRVGTDAPAAEAASRTEGGHVGGGTLVVGPLVLLSLLSLLLLSPVVGGVKVRRRPLTVAWMGAVGTLLGAGA
jgi:hypothetical protein